MEHSLIIKTLIIIYRNSILFLATTGSTLIVFQELCCVI
nr:MAG TPA: hypothetical protein [Caudoviricetes sp.]DAT57472.1 MAG TPA: hypothetical protein [Caudoviricetes sp.]